MDVSPISESIQPHPEDIVHRADASEVGSSTEPTLTMLRRIAPAASEDMLDFIDSHAKKFKAISDSYVPAESRKKYYPEGLITAYPQTGHYSIASPDAASAQGGGGSGAHLSYPAPSGRIPGVESASTMAPIAVSITI